MAETSAAVCRANMAESSAAVCRAELPSECIHTIHKQIKKNAKAYANVFRHSEDAEYFAMLPLQPQQKKWVLDRACEIHNESKQINTK